MPSELINIPGEVWLQSILELEWSFSTPCPWLWLNVDWNFVIFYVSTPATWGPSLCNVTISVSSTNVKPYFEAFVNSTFRQNKISLWPTNPDHTEAQNSCFHRLNISPKKWKLWIFFRVSWISSYFAPVTQPYRNSKTW